MALLTRGRGLSLREAQRVHISRLLDVAWRWYKDKGGAVVGPGRSLIGIPNDFASVPLSGSSYTLLHG